MTRPLPLLLLAACAGGSFDRGETAAMAGLDPLGGAFNPALARCVVTRTRDDVVEIDTYDRAGRQVEVHTTRDGVESTTEVDWKGPCRVLVRTSGDAYVTETTSTCDDEGWPVEGTTTEGDDVDTVTTFSIENTYDDGRIAQTVRTDDDGTSTTTYAWAGDRLAHTEVDGFEATDLTFNDDGWIAERVVTYGGESPNTLTWVYDDQGRLTERRDDGATAATFTYDHAEDRWPVFAEYTGYVTEDLEFDCP